MEQCDFVVYSLRCKLDYDFPEVTPRFVSHRGSGERRPVHNTVHKRHCRGASSNNKNFWVTNQEGDKLHPLWVELAHAADRVYYVGETEHPKRRIPAHIRNNASASQAMEYLQITGLESIDFHTYDDPHIMFETHEGPLNRDALLERAKIERKILLEIHPDDESLEIQCNHVVSTLEEADRLTQRVAHDCKFSCDEVRVVRGVPVAGMLSRLSRAMKDCKSKAEKEKAEHLTNIDSTEEEDYVRLEDINKYAYRM